MFEVKWKHNDEKVKVYDTLVEVNKGDGYLYPTTKFTVFLIYDTDTGQWRRIPSHLFEPVD